MPRRKAAEKERHPRPSCCIVCGSAAAGYNYDAPSCASCKAFFRRVVIKQHVFPECNRNGLCARDVRRCRTCRYEKCIKGGMNPLIVNCPEYSDSKTVFPETVIESEPSTSSVTECSFLLEDSPRDESTKIQMDINENESDHKEKSPLHRCHSSLHDAEYASIDISGSQIGHESNMHLAQSPMRIESKLEQLMENLHAIEDAHHKLRISSYMIKFVPELRINDFYTGHSKLGANFEPMESHSEPRSIVLVPVQVIINKRLVRDHSKLEQRHRKIWPIEDVVYSIEFIKALPFYQLLDECSKIVLIGSALICSNFTTAFYSYSNHADRTTFPDGSSITWDRDVQEQSPDSTRFHTGLIAAMREAELDRREYALLKLIIVCNPILDGLSDYDVIVLQQVKERCTKTLLSYVLARRGVCEGPAYFAKILSIVDVTTKLTSWQKSTHILGLAMGLYKNMTPFAETIFHSQ